MLPLSFDKGDKKAFSYNKKKSYLNWGYYCDAYDNFWEGLLLYWQMKIWTKFYFVFPSFWNDSFFQYRNFFPGGWVCELVLRGAVDMPGLNCTQVNSLTKDKFLIVWVLLSSLSSLFLWFSVSVFFFQSFISSWWWSLNY